MTTGEALPGLLRVIGCPWDSSPRYAPPDSHVAGSQHGGATGQKSGPDRAVEQTVVQIVPVDGDSTGLIPLILLMLTVQTVPVTGLEPA